MAYNTLIFNLLNTSNVDMINGLSDFDEWVRNELEKVDEEAKTSPPIAGRKALFALFDDLDQSIPTAFVLKARPHIQSPNPEIGKIPSHPGSLVRAHNRWYTKQRKLGK